MSDALSITTMHVVQGGILKRPIPLHGRTVSDVEGRLYIGLVISAPLTRRLLCVPDKARLHIRVLAALMELRNSKTAQLLCPSHAVIDDQEEAEVVRFARINGNEGVATRAKKRNQREALPTEITIIAPRIDVGDAVVGGFPMRVVPLSGKLNSPMFIELTSDNVEYLQTVAAHEMRVKAPRADTRESVHRDVKGITRDEAGKRYLCRVQEDGRQRAKVFSAKRHQTMAAAEAEATEFALNAHR